jgi:SnoaL-like domain
MPAPEASVELIARRFVEGFNRRDAESLVALSDPSIEFHPTPLLGKGQLYRGHDGLRRWIADLEASGIGHEGRLREVRSLEDGFVLFSDVVLDGKLICPAALVVRLNERHEIVDARGLLTDSELLSRVGVNAGSPSSLGPIPIGPPPAERREPA